MLLLKSLCLFLVCFQEFFHGTFAQRSRFQWLTGLAGLFGIEADPRGRSSPGTCPKAPHYNPCVPKRQANARVMQCCRNIPGIPEACLPYCTLDLSAAQLIQLYLTGVCAPDGTDKNLKGFMGCLSGGRDVTPCCRAKGVPSPCDGFCDPEHGMPAIRSRLDQFKCLMTFSKVRNCFWGVMN